MRNFSEKSMLPTFNWYPLYIAFYHIITKFYELNLCLLLRACLFYHLEEIFSFIVVVFKKKKLAILECFGASLQSSKLALMHTFF